MKVYSYYYNLNIKLRHIVSTSIFLRILSTQLDPRIYRVVFNGNGFTNRIYTRYGSIKCSEIALENGYKYFISIEGSNTVSQSTTNQPTRSRSDFKISESYDGYGLLEIHIHGGGSYTISSHPPEYNFIVERKIKIQIQLFMTLYFLKIV